MYYRPVYLAVFRRSEAKRARFAIFIPNAGSAAKDPNNRSIPCRGTLIHVVGTPVSGYGHEFRRNYDCTQPSELKKMVRLGWVDSSCIADPLHKTYSKDYISMGWLDYAALQVPAPCGGQDLTAPVDGVRVSQFPS